jgi:hypothetical protein
LRTAPYFFECGSYADFPRAIRAAVAAAAAQPDFAPVRRQVSANEAGHVMEGFLSQLAGSRNEMLSAFPINPDGFDLRLGRHHGLATGPNRIEQDLGAFIKALGDLPDQDILDLAQNGNPELAIAARFPTAPRAASETRNLRFSEKFARRLAKVFS